MLKTRTRHSLLFVILFFTGVTHGAVIPESLPVHYPVPGGIAVIALPESAKPDAATFNGRRIMLQKRNNQWYAIAGLALSIKPGKHTIHYKAGGRTKKVSFTIEPKSYATQHLTIKNKRKVNPYKKDLERIGRERTIIRRALNTWTEQQDIPLQFSIPVQGRMSSPFGLRRFFNGQARRPHSGLDIAAPTGTPIHAPANGKVITVGDYFFNGKTVFLDHGQGLVTMFCHLSEIQVKDNQLVSQGDVIGQVGMTGRVTGPHLHWGVSLNNVRIEPLLLLGPEYAKPLFENQPD